MVNLFEVTDRHVFTAVQLITRFRDQSLSLVDGFLAVVSEEFRLPVWSYDHHMDLLGVQRWLPE